VTVILAIDLSASLDFFSNTKSKKEIAAEISAIIAFTANLNSDKVGLLLFTDRVECFIPPKKGKTHILRIIREILQFEPEGKGTSIETGLVYLNKVLKKRSILFLVSDFMDKGFSQSLSIAARKHDLITIKINDPREKILPDSGMFILKDPETGEEFYADFSSVATQKTFREILSRKDTQLTDMFKKSNIDYLSIDSESEYEKPLFDFFLKRKKKYSR